MADNGVVVVDRDTMAGRVARFNERVGELRRDLGRDVDGSFVDAFGKMGAGLDGARLVEPEAPEAPGTVPTFTKRGLGSQTDDFGLG